MKPTVTVARIFTGLLFIFSGLVKALDPRGLGYKMEEFFEVWASEGYMKGLMDVLHNHALQFSIFMITLEVILGVAILLGWQKKLVTWLLFLLMLFFTFLTSYVLFSGGKIRECGCFGNCIPLTPIQTFTKDIILLILTILLLLNRRYILPLAKPLQNLALIILAIILTLALQAYVLKHMPLVDCLPYKKGNNILELRKMPAGAIQDKFDYVFIYEKNGSKKEFPVSALPDSSWKFFERKQKLITRGKDNIPLINDFSLTAESGTDSTDAILNVDSAYYLFFIKEVPNDDEKWIPDFKRIFKEGRDKQLKCYVVTSQKNAINVFLKKNEITADAVFTCDATAIKTAARVDPALFLMQGPMIQDKISWADFDDVIKK